MRWLRGKHTWAAPTSVLNYSWINQFNQWAFRILCPLMFLKATKHSLSSNPSKICCRWIFKRYLADVCIYYYQCVLVWLSAVGSTAVAISTCHSIKTLSGETVAPGCYLQLRWASLPVCSWHSSAQLPVMWCERHLSQPLKVFQLH